MSKFYQPYQFVPVKGISDDKLVDYDQIKDNSNEHPARHDYWAEANSGRIICMLTLETPTLLGLEHHDLNGKGKSPNTLVKPQLRKFANESCYYIPGNTLRGLTGSIAEAITQSSLRVLEDTELKISFGPKNSQTLGTVHQYFEPISSSSLPLGAQSRKTKKLSPAELLFGCIEMQDNSSDDSMAFALASRVSFSDARLTKAEDEPLQDEIILKVLGTPKTNSHNLYYRNKKGQQEFIDKGELTHNHHQPNGRKFYLHATSSMVENESWKVEQKDISKPKLHVKGKPFKQGQEFTFHIDFENLTDAELSVLITSLRPAKDFRHKLGMGKPVGLGTVRIDTQGVFLIDRKKRYGKNALQQQRYCEVFVDANSEANAENLETYKAEHKVWIDSDKKEVYSVKPELIDTDDALAVLKRIGKWPYTPKEESYKMDYPYMEDDKGEITGTGFEWFVRNEKVGGYQYLEKVDPKEPLPTLERYKK